MLIVPTALARGRVSHLTPLCQVPCRAIENQVAVLYRLVLRLRVVAATLIFSHLPSTALQ